MSDAWKLKKYKKDDFNGIYLHIFNFRSEMLNNDKKNSQSRLGQVWETLIYYDNK